jgi:Xaa-Pro aminopeptidase
VLSYAAMRILGWVLAAALISSVALSATSKMNVRERRQRAATAFHDGIVLFHASSEMDLVGDGFRQDPLFYYFTGLENTVGAVLAIEGKSGESWLFLPTKPPFASSGLKPEVEPGQEAARSLGIEHVVDWSEMNRFFASRATEHPPLYFADDRSKFDELPSDLESPKSSGAPAWMQVILQRWPNFEAQESSQGINALLAVQTPEEADALRMAAKTTVTALMAGLRAIRPGVSQRSVEAAVVNSCWSSGAHGVSFWPWAMAGENAVFPRPFHSVARYDHLDRKMVAGELVRLDVGCEWDHYSGDLGRTVPVSGHYDQGQRETWTVFVAAYHAGAAALHDGATVDDVFKAWRTELMRHRESAKSSLARHAIESWSDRKNVPHWQVHTMNLIAGYPVGPLLAGTTVNFEPIASVDGQGFFLEDMYRITTDGAELLTPGVPYSAEEVEAAVGR